MAVLRKKRQTLDSPNQDPRAGSPLIPRRSIRWTLYFGFWTIWGLLNAFSATVDATREAPGIAIWKPVLWEMSSLYTTALLCPLVVAFTLTIRRSDRSLVLKFLQHAPGPAIFSLAHTSGMVALRKLVYWLAGESYDYAVGLVAKAYLYEFSKDIRLYVVIALLTLGFDAYRRYRERELQASRLQTRLAEAELQNLKGQLNPHFLFNSLNMISSIMHQDIPSADHMLSQLSDLLRMALARSRQAEVSLKEEVEFLDLYLEIMQRRFQDKLRVVKRIDSQALSAAVPHMILQPLVENAIQHGISRLPQGGVVEISIESSRNGKLILRVADDGPGADQMVWSQRPGAAPTAHRQHGLANVSERLVRLYGDQQRLSLGNRREGGFEAVVEIPFRGLETPLGAKGHQSGKGLTV